MRNIFLTAVVVCALVIAGIGGVFANYQDIDISEDNAFETGSLDLKVSRMEGEDNVLYDTPYIPQLVNIVNGMPDCIEDKTFMFDLHNAGNYTQDDGKGWVYLHIKGIELEDTGRTEPEDAVELGENPIGELADGTVVALSPNYIGPPQGKLGEGWGTSAANGTLPEHIRVKIWTSRQGYTGPWNRLDLSAYENEDGDVKLDKLVCNQIPLGRLDSLQTMYVKIQLMLQDIPEELIGYDLFGEGSKWSDWPTNALQDDKVTFDMSFELFHQKMH